MQRSLVIRAGRETQVSTFSLMLTFTLVFILFSCVSQAQGQNFSLSLNGQSWVKVPNSPTLDPDGSFTIEAWINPSAIGTAEGIVEHYNNSVITGSDGGYALRLLKTGQIAFFTFQNSVTYDRLVSNTTLSANSMGWHHIAGVFQASTSQMFIYIDGTQDTAVGPGINPPASTGPFFIGEEAGGTNQFTGLIGDVRFTREAVYLGTFQPSANLPVIPGFTEGLWTFANQTLNDTSGNANNGALKGTPATPLFSTNVPTSASAPTVTITGPTGQITTTTTLTQVTLTANATISQGTVSDVLFTLTSPALANPETVSATTPSSSSGNTYSFAVAVSLNAGTYTLTGVATGSDGVTGPTSNPVNFTIAEDTGPTVVITPPKSLTVGAGTTVTLQATATPNGAPVSSVSYFYCLNQTGVTCPADNVLIGTSMTAPYMVNWTSIAGNYLIYAQATDQSNVTGPLSAAVDIMVTPGPSVSITAPGSTDSFLTSSNITIYALAQDSSATVTQVSFFACSTSLSCPANNISLGTSTSLPYNVTWSNVPAGTYNLTAKAVDSGGGQSTSAPITITVGSTSAPDFQGSIAGATCTTVTGSAWDRTQPNAAINVSIYGSNSGTPLATVTANTFSQNLLDEGEGNGDHFFSVTFPALTANESVYAVFTGTSQQLGLPPGTVPTPGVPGIPLTCIAPPGTTTGSVNPKFIVLGVFYAPPGSKSTAMYGHTAMEGASTSYSSSFSTSEMQSVALTDGNNMLGTITETASSMFTQQQSSSNSIAVNTTTNNTKTIDGPANSGLGVDHQFDVIRVWLNPVLNYTLTGPPSNTVVWNGYSFDEADLPALDIQDMFVKDIEAYIAGTPFPPGSSLLRSWAVPPEDGSGSALTVADLQQILAADPFTSQTPPYVPTLAPNSNCTVDHRYCVVPGTQNGVFQYNPAPPGGQNGPNTFSVANQNTTTEGTGSQDTFQTSFSIEKKTGSDFSSIFSADIKASVTLTSTNTFNSTLTQSSTNTTSFSITGPLATDNYPPGAPTEISIFEDTLYSTYMFAAFPSPTFAISLGQNKITIPPPTGGTTGGTDCGNSCVSPSGSSSCGSLTVSINDLPSGLVFTGTASLTLLGFPTTDGTFSFSPVSANGPFNSTLNICVTNTSLSGSQMVHVVGTSGNESHVADLLLKF